MSEKTIQFFNEDNNYKLKFSNTTTNWLTSIANNHKKKVTNINYIFCSDEYLLEVNKEHLNHDYYTDIITFDMSDDDSLEADIFVSIDRVGENAKKETIVFETELYRVLVHGLLHLIGFNDKTEIEKTEMRKQEDISLLLLNK